MKPGLACCAALLVLACTASAASAAPRDRVAPSIPGELRVIAVTEDSITLSWNASTDNSGKVHAYIVNGVYHPGTSTTKTMTGLVPSWTASFRVEAIDAAGNRSGLSNTATGTTSPDTTPPTTPGDLRLTGSTPSSVSLAWNRSSDRWSVGYRVYMDGQEVGSAGDVSFRVLGLAPGSTHTFTVRARDGGGNLSPPSNALTVTLAASTDSTPPSPPANLSARDAGDFCGGNRLLWDAAADDQDPPSAIEYEVRLDGRPWHLTAPGVASAYLYTFTGTNTWTVVAVDRAGNRSAPSEPATVSVVADPDLC